MEGRAQETMRLMSYYRCALREVETKFNVLNEDFSLLHDRNPIAAIHSRIKSMSSIEDKLRRKGLEFTLANMENHLCDIAGLRIICAFPEDVYLLADALLRQDDIRLLHKKDYIANPKPNGYRSLHLIVEVPIFLANEKRPMKVEIQLRTIAMDCWASLEHQLRYKKDRAFTPRMAEELRQCAELSAQLDSRMDALRKQVLELPDGEGCEEV